MSPPVARTCTEVLPAGSDRRGPPESWPLSACRELPAYVLLGDPGAGKTTAFEAECKALGDTALRIDARDFMTFDPGDHPEWRDKTLFIDALDEVRAGSPDARVPLDAIRGRLDKLGKPRFRLSCRAADWRGEQDRRRLSAVAPSGSRPALLLLDPLTDDGVTRILAARDDIADPREFMCAARGRGLGGLLENPLSLRLLADVVTREHQWPASRLKLFESATSLLATEENKEHAYSGPQPEVHELTDAAGRLCAVLLVSGASGYALERDHAGDDYLPVGRCGYEPRHLLRAALATRLFTVRSGDRVAPVHRHVAEFAGARHLARVVSAGLPARRVTALLEGYDGGVVTSLRGLSAWFAALCDDARAELVDRDPVAVVAYGDAQGFSIGHKHTLLQALSRDADRLNTADWTATTIGSVVTPGMEPVLQGILESQDEHPPRFVMFVLSALAHGARLPGIADALLRIVYDSGRQLQFPALALEAYVHHCGQSDVAADTLEQLLADIAENRVRDWQDELTAVALRHLYPDRIPPATIWDHLTESANQHAADYRAFWISDLPRRSSDAHVARLLDELVVRGDSLKPALESRHLEEMPAEILARGLESRGDGLTGERLFHWLHVDPFRDLRMSNGAVRRIRAWLEQRPEIWKTVVARYVNTAPGELMESAMRDLLYGARPPSDFGRWSLDQAVAATERRVAEFYFTQSCGYTERQDGDRRLSIEDLEKAARTNEWLRTCWDTWRVYRLRADHWDPRHRRRSYLRERESRRRGFVALVASQADALRENRCGAGLLHELAKAYFGMFSDVAGNNPEERMKDLFHDDASLIEATFTGLRGTPFRDDVPDPREIIELLKSGEQHAIGLPFLAGIDELEDPLQLSDHRLRQALAFHFCTFVDNSRDRERRLLAASVSAAGEILRQCISVKLSAHVYDHTVAYHLAKGEYVRLARHVVLPVLRAFPLSAADSRSTAKPGPMTTLDALLVAAVLHAARTEFVALIAEKLSRSSMNVSQRVHWMAVRVVAAPDTHFDSLREFVGGRERRVAQLAGFLDQAGCLLDDLPARTLAAFVRLLARTAAPWGAWQRADAWEEVHGHERDVFKCVWQMVRVLADRPDRHAGEELAGLAADSDLDDWRQVLVNARDRQRVHRRDATYRHPTAEQVCRTLDGGCPANAADLAALLVDRLRQLACQICTDNTDDWRQYWNEAHGQQPTPKHEEQCRDALLSDLRPSLGEGMDAQPEGQYANDKRADIRVAYGDFQVPIEIKKNEHRDLWSAAMNQLIGQYARDPATDGNGIYLVFWFGKEHTQAPPTGAPPTSPSELRTRLEAALTRDERRRIAVVVIDVSRPQPTV